MSNQQQTPEQLRAQYEEIRATNPFAAARFALAQGLHDMPRPANAAPNAGDASTRLAALRPSGPAPEVGELAADDPRRVHAELQKTNPALASRFAVANGLHDRK